MRVPGVWLSLVVLVAALPGCRPAERARTASGAGDPAAVRVVADTMRYVTGDPVATTTTVVTDTLGDWRPPAPEPNDCRYAGTRPRPATGDPERGEPYDSVAMMAGVPFRCRLRPEGPEVRLVVGGASSIPMGVHVYLPPDAGRPVQTLALDNDQPALEGSDLLVGEDLNGDGWMDLRVFTFSGTGGQMSDVFRFEPASRRFVPDSVLPKGNVLRLAEPGCVGTGHKMNASDHTSADYCWRDGAWVRVRTFAQKGIGQDRVIRTEHRLRGGRLRPFRFDTVPWETPPWPRD